MLAEDTTNGRRPRTRLEWAVHGASLGRVEEVRRLAARLERKDGRVLVEDGIELLWQFRAKGAVEAGCLVCVTELGEVEPPPATVAADEAMAKTKLANHANPVRWYECE